MTIIILSMSSELFLKVCKSLVCYPLYSKMHILLPKSGHGHIYMKVTVEAVFTNGFGLHTGIFTALLSVLDSSGTNIQGTGKEYEYDL